MVVRLFVGVDIRSPSVLSKLRLAKGSLESSGADLKLVEDENLHITLVFIGEVEERVVPLIREALSGVAFGRFSAHLKGVGCFPSCTRPRVIWVGISEGAEKLVELHKLVAGALRRQRIPFESEKGYVPHLTLARVRSGKNLDKLWRILQGLEHEDFGFEEVLDFRLKKSTLTPKGPVYENLHVFPLTP